MNKVLFEISYIGSLHGFFNTILFFCILIFLYFGSKRTAKDHKRKWDRKLAKIFMKIDMIIFVIYTISLVKGYIDTVLQYKTGHYIEIEGIVEGYSANLMNQRGPIESFALGGVRFECSDGATWGYCPTRTNGGVIAGNGQHLRIRYIRNGDEKVIVYIEQMIPEEDD